ncbi:hypothetical protein OG592_27055 [Streptomyces avidinii]|uniref:hypothetical protein n=1 Tax=Streptomyces avidinii TaxID=1895 RepID=UPI00386B7186|nr:hypothetical protein OG592_27055 [Streptomyces avidinii]
MNLTPHTITVTTIDGGRDYDWTHPTTCPDGDQCEFTRRIRRACDGDIAALTDGRPDGSYLLGLFGFHGLCLIDDTGRMLLDAEPADTVPNGCHWCGIVQRGHARQWTAQAGWHSWEQPSQEQIKARTIARRAA